ncbi:MAG: SEC-C metal-binding domain-containing protein [Cyclobacteriaceae bacterium]
MGKISRNDPCHCGSGKKYKNCHMGSETSSRGMNKAFILVGILLALIAIGIIGYYTNTNSNSNAAVPAQGYTPSPPPAGEAPPGKVWSYEHGHWHDAF